ncbi:MAG TPA: GNAT family protein [Thermoplasmata archaeon]|nr:GNAT family protein [Thermoplasmata archaeon]
MPSPRDRRDAFVRAAGLRDLGALVRLYRSQLADGTPVRLDPFPFDRPRLVLLLFALLAIQPGVGVLRRIAPGWATWVIVAGPNAARPPVGVGFVHQVRGPDGRWIGRTGLLVGAPHQRQGWGTAIKIAQLRLCRAQGIPRIQAFLSPENAGSARVNRGVGLAIRSPGPGDPSRDRPYLIAEGDVDAVLRALDATASPADSVPPG